MFIIFLYENIKSNFSLVLHKFILHLMQCICVILPYTLHRFLFCRISANYRKKKTNNQ